MAVTRSSPPKQFLGQGEILFRRHFQIAFLARHRFDLDARQRRHLDIVGDVVRRHVRGAPPVYRQSGSLAGSGRGKDRRAAPVVQLSPSLRRSVSATASIGTAPARARFQRRDHTVDHLPRHQRPGGVVDQDKIRRLLLPALPAPAAPNPAAGRRRSPGPRRRGGPRHKALPGPGRSPP